MIPDGIADLTGAEARLLLVLLYAGSEKLSAKELRQHAGIDTDATYYKALKRIRPLLTPTVQAPRQQQTSAPAPRNEKVSKVLRAWNDAFPKTALSPAQAAQLIRLGDMDMVLSVIEAASRRPIQAPIPYVLSAVRRKAGEKPTPQPEREQESEELREPTQEELEEIRRESDYARRLLEENDYE